MADLNEKNEQQLRMIFIKDQSWILTKDQSFQIYGKHASLAYVNVLRSCYNYLLLTVSHNYKKTYYIIWRFYLDAGTKSAIYHRDMKVRCEGISAM